MFYPSRFYLRNANKVSGAPVPEREAIGALVSMFPSTYFPQEFSFSKIYNGSEIDVPQTIYNEHYIVLFGEDSRPDVEPAQQGSFYLDEGVPISDLDTLKSYLFSEAAYNAVINTAGFAMPCFVFHGYTDRPEAWGSFTSPWADRYFSIYFSEQPRIIAAWVQFSEQWKPIRIIAVNQVVLNETGDDEQHNFNIVLPVEVGFTGLALFMPTNRQGIDITWRGGFGAAFNVNNMVGVEGLDLMSEVDDLVRQAGDDSQEQHMLELLFSAFGLYLPTTSLYRFGYASQLLASLLQDDALPGDDFHVSCDVEDNKSGAYYLLDWNVLIADN